MVVIQICSTESLRDIGCCSCRQNTLKALFLVSLLQSNTDASWLALCFSDTLCIHAENMRLVKAVLVAGLYPNVARLDGSGGKSADGKKPKLITRTAGGKSGARAHMPPMRSCWGLRELSSP